MVSRAGNVIFGAAYWSFLNHFLKPQRTDQILPKSEGMICVWVTSGLRHDVKLTTWTILFSGWVGAKPLFSYAASQRIGLG
ncbi:MAG TPA: hypothetical protein DEF12_04430 [Rhodobacteraceae bacterium]|nr:hypothetical protein [Paracoccaceae bacterium]